MKDFNPKRIVCFSLVLLLSLVAVAQRTVSGTITSEDGKALQGATVTEKGTKNVAIASAAGTFSIKTTSSKPTLVISYSGSVASRLA